jgi:hypothetical protein
MRVWPAVPFLIVAIAVAPSVQAVPHSPPRADASIAELWEQPVDLASRDLFAGPWDPGLAPDPHAVFTFVRRKKGGANPGVVVRDPAGREWHVKQANRSLGDEGPVEVALSRVLSALGYHQPPVFWLPSFTMTDPSGTRVEAGGRFRLHDGPLRDGGEWSWQDNPFVGTRPFNGLLVILLMFNSSDLKNSNNTIYEATASGVRDRRYAVRDLGSALGKPSPGRARRNDIDRFERTGFLRGVSNDGFVEFDFHGKHPELVSGRITLADLGWAQALIGQLTARQWADAFRAGGYPPELAARFIARLRERVAQAGTLAGNHHSNQE